MEGVPRSGGEGGLKAGAVWGGTRYVRMVRRSRGVRALADGKRNGWRFLRADAGVIGCAKRLALLNCLVSQQLALNLAVRSADWLGSHESQDHTARFLWLWKSPAPNRM